MTQVSFADFHKSLKSKSESVNVKTENTKPTMRTVGFVRESDVRASVNEASDDFILHDAPDFLNKKGSVMSKSEDSINSYPYNEGFIKLPRSLIQSEEWRNLRMKRQILFLYILQRVQFTPIKKRYKGKDFMVMPGQLCISYRKLLEDFNETVRFSDDKIDLNFLQRSVSQFSARYWIDTQNDTGIMIITITYPELYEHFKSQYDTANDTVIDTLAIQRKERKKEKKIAYEKGAILKAEESAPEKSPPSNKIKEGNSEEDFIALKEFCQSRGLKITDKDFRIWLKKYKASYVTAHIGLLIERLVSKSPTAKSIDSHAKWMESALKNKWADEKINREINSIFSMEFKEKKQWKDLEIHEKFCIDLKTGEQYSYLVSEVTFKNILIKAEEKRRNGN